MLNLEKPEQIVPETEVGEAQTVEKSEGLTKEEKEEIKRELKTEMDKFTGVDKAMEQAGVNNNLIRETLLNASIPKIVELLEIIYNEFSLGEKYDLAREYDFRGLAQRMLDNGNFYYGVPAQFITEPRPKIEARNPNALNAEDRYKTELNNLLKEHYDISSPVLSDIIKILESDDFYQLKASDLKPLNHYGEVKLNGRNIFSPGAAAFREHIGAIFAIVMKYDKDLVLEILKANLGSFEERILQREERINQRMLENIARFDQRSQERRESEKGKNT